MGTRFLIKDKDKRLIDIYEVSFSVFRNDGAFAMPWRKIISDALDGGNSVEISPLED